MQCPVLGEQSFSITERCRCINGDVPVNSLVFSVVDTSSHHSLEAIEIVVPLSHDRSTVVRPSSLLPRLRMTNMELILLEHIWGDLFARSQCRWQRGCRKLKSITVYGGEGRDLPASLATDPEDLWTWLPLDSQEARDEDPIASASQCEPEERLLWLRLHVDASRLGGQITLEGPQYQCVTLGALIRCSLVNLSLCSMPLLLHTPVDYLGVGEERFDIRGLQRDLRRLRERASQLRIDATVESCRIEQERSPQATQPFIIIRAAVSAD
jgi:hypothetical protein